MNITRQLQQEFKDNACFRMGESFRMIQKSFIMLEEEDIWKRPNSHSNSIGNLILHLRGNITQYAIAALAQKPDLRERDKEFSTASGNSKSELLQLLHATIQEAQENIQACEPESLLQVREVQGFRISGLGIILHVVEHLSYHTGQIAFWIKVLKDQDLRFYEGTDLNRKNKR